MRSEKFELSMVLFVAATLIGVIGGLFWYFPWWMGVLALITSVPLFFGIVLKLAHG